ncbi:hypothetical protein E2C01_061351 [Portunus trituberculatus]|uniref:Uncharacterized protein n=1 Tax=Portunus trituberculatus TaxID=210409 RepID=A0A5B7HET4_PORTR|nr:hypothetical protein [Portunus trituberculatus]
MCPNSVQKVTKIRNSSNMVLLTFFGSTLPDRVHIGPINLRRFRQSLGRFTKRPVLWWNAARTNTVKEKRTAFSRLRRHRRDPQCLDAFRGCRARARRVLKEA